jgi:putative restriction endonuclease
VTEKMQAYVGITDQRWFDFLRRQPHLEEVNFWRPSAKQSFRALQRGELFLFKLHSPNDYIVGGGIFLDYTLLPINLAWESYEKSNGAGSLLDLRIQVAKYRHEEENFIADYTIGCILLTQPFFLPERNWITVPDWRPGIQQGKTYDLTIEPGLTIWKRLHLEKVREYETQEIKGGWGAPTLFSPRLGQGAFRVLVTNAYERRCAVTNEKTLPALDAAHIKPYSESGQHEVNNGILLRRDLHALFDQGYVTISPLMRLEVSRRIREWIFRPFRARHSGLVEPLSRIK